MSLEEAMSKLAASMDRYASVMESIASTNPSHVVAPAGPSSDETPATPAKGKRRTKEEIAAAAKAEADALRDAGGADDNEADPFADDDDEPAAKAITKDDVRKLVLGVKEKDETFAKKLLEKLGVKTLGTIAEKDYPKVVELAAKVGVTL